MAAMTMSSRFMELFGGAALSRLKMVRPDPVVPDEAEEARARRAFLMEMMEDAPGAFLSEDSVGGAMYFFSGRF